MISIQKLTHLAQLLGGQSTGWRNRFGEIVGLSRGHVSNLLTGSRPMTQLVLANIIDSATAEARLLRKRADEIEAALAAILPTQEEAGTLPSHDEPADNE